MIRKSVKRFSEQIMLGPMALAWRILAARGAQFRCV
jgi:hypothetical protein